MQPNEVARKRAEANAIKQRFDVDFLFSEEDIDFDIQIGEPEEELKSAEQAGEELGFDMVDADVRETTPRPEPSSEGELAEKSKWKPGQIKMVLENSYIVEEDKAIAFLDRTGFNKSATQGAVKTFIKYFQAGLDQDMSKKDALDYAKENWNK